MEAGAEEGGRRVERGRGDQAAVMEATKLLMSGGQGGGVALSPPCILEGQ